MSKKTSYILLSILVIVVTAIGAYIGLAPEKYFELKLDPSPGRMTAGNAIIIELKSENKGLELEGGTATIQFDNEKLELVETTGEANGGKIKFTISKETANQNGEQKIGSLKVKSKDSGTSAIELADSSITDINQQKITPRFVPGLYAASVSIAPTGRTSN